MIVQLIPVQYRALALVLAVLVLVGGGYWWGGHNARNACAAANGKASAKVEQAEDKRDANIDAIAAATADAVASELNQNKADANESAQIIRTVYVPGNCRAIDPIIVQQLRTAADGINAKVGISMRPAGAGAGSGNP